MPADHHDHNNDAENDRTFSAPPAKKATLSQVAATLFWGMCMIGKKNTWERDGAKISLRQIIVGAVIAGCIVVILLVLLARFVAH